MQALATSAFDSVTGFGVEAVVDDHSILVGAERLMERHGIVTDTMSDAANALARAGKTPIYAAVDGQLAALLGVADPVKPMSAQAVNAIKARGLKVAMVTGDNRATAEAIAAQLSVDHIVADVLPGGKVDAVEELRGANGRVVVRWRRDQ